MGQAIRSCPHYIRDCPLSVPAPSPSRRVARAIDALRHGWPLAFASGRVLLPVETAITTDAQAAILLISHARAATLKLTNQRDAAAHSPVLITDPDGFNRDWARIIADPALDMTYPMKGPFKALALDWEEEAHAAMELARLAGILPAFLVDAEGSGETEYVEAGDLAAWSDSAQLILASRARLPVSAAEDAEIMAFRSINDTREHVALVIGMQNSDTAPLVRLHSECLTGDILGSLKCDCGPQLDGALAAMAAEAERGGWGILLYLRQEGRGIGLINKLRAYGLQDQGFDTVDANERLGLPDEARDFPIAARMLALLGAKAVRLLTNNPAKVAALISAGVHIAERVPHALPANPHNHRYLETKRDRAGHLI